MGRCLSFYLSVGSRFLGTPGQAMMLSSLEEPLVALALGRAPEGYPGHRGPFSGLPAADTND